MEKVRIQDDLYTFVNQEKLDQLVIPDDKPATGGFNLLADEVEEIMMNEFREMSTSENYPNEYLKRACTLFKVAKDVEKKDKDGIAPALKHLAIINEIDSIETFNKMFKTLMLKGIPLPIQGSVETDMKNTQEHKLYIQGPRVILPDAAYYKPERAEQKEMILGIWTNMARMIMAKTDLSAEEQNEYIEDTLAFDSVLGDLVKTSEEWSEYVEMYNPMKTSKVASMLKSIKFKQILKDLFNEVPEIVVVSEPRYFKNFVSVFNEETLVKYKHWAYVTGLINSCILLSEELRELGSLYFRTIAGIPANTPVEKFAYQLASDVYGEPIGLYYGEKYFGEAAKKDITEIVYQIIDGYKRELKIMIS